MEEFIKIDSHVHSKGVSKCSRVTCEEIIDQKIALGYDGAVLTNHCQAWYYPPEEHAAWAKNFLEEYERGRKYAKARGFTFLLGIEISLNDPHYADWLVYGVTESFLREVPAPYTLKQKELFEACEAYGMVMVQAHPYRQSPANVQYMHGVEINCTPGDLERADEVLAFAKQNKRLVTCGTDYHTADRDFFGGMMIPNGIETGEEFAKYLLSTIETKVFLKEKLLTIPTFKEKAK
ncbi:MAG: PHP domain-containing protein [Clostridiales bacterium]|nr:PHP domain-containing protein [Clostridiales bacterium]